MNRGQPSYKRLWIVLTFVIIASFAVLGGQQVGSIWGHGDYLADFLQTPAMQNLRWLRMIGDTIFAAGVLSLMWFKLGLLTGHSFAKSSELALSEVFTPEAESIFVA